MAISIFVVAFFALPVKILAEESKEILKETPAEDLVLPYPKIYLSEVMPRNYKNEDNIDCKEFVEIYNSEDIEIDLAGWMITDKLGVVKKYFLTQKIEDKSYLILSHYDLNDFVTLNDIMPCLLK